MIHIVPEMLRRAYPPMTAEFTSRMDRMIRTLSSEKEAKPVKHPSFRLIFALLLILAALSVTAYAATRPAVLEWLLHGAPASEQLMDIAQDINAESSADGITARITGVVYDGTQLSFSFEIENSAPAVPALAAFDREIKLNGHIAEIFYASAMPEQPRMVPSPHLDVLPVQRNPLMGGGDILTLPAQMSGAVSSEMKLRVYRPAVGFAVVGELPGDTHDPDLQDVLNTLRSFTNTVIADVGQQDPEYWAEQGYVVTDHTGNLLHDLDEELAAGRLLETACIPITFTFHADNAVIYDFSDAQDVPLAGCKLHISRFRLTALSTEVEVYLIPSENTRDAAQMLADQHGAAALLDPQGRPVAYSEMDWLSSDLPSIMQTRDGQWVCEYSIDMPGLLTFPDSVGFSTQAGELCRFELR